MLPKFLFQTALSVLSVVLGAGGVFCAVLSFTEPTVAANALVLLGAALAVNYYVEAA